MGLVNLMQVFHIVVKVEKVPSFSFFFFFVQLVLLGYLRKNKRNRNM